MRKGPDIAYDDRNKSMFICDRYSVYISHVILYSRACGSLYDFFDRGLLLRKKLLKQGFLVVKWKSSLGKIYGRHHDLVKPYPLRPRVLPKSKPFLLN
jgi:hypothetical protein